MHAPLLVAVIWDVLKAAVYEEDEDMVIAMLEAAGVKHQVGQSLGGGSKFSSCHISQLLSHHERRASRNQARNRPVTAGLPGENV